jgi:hypothetical protein
MSTHHTAQATIHGGQNSPRLALRAWVLANALGLGTTFALFAVVGEAMEAAGAEHDTVGWGVPTVAAMVVGGSLFAYLRQRVLGGPNRWLHTLVIGVAVAAGFVAGSFPPIDFVTGISVAGVVAGALQLREVRRLGDSRRLLLLSVGTWLVAGMAAVAAAILVADVIISGALGRSDLVDGVGGFVAILALAGVVGGTVGGAIEGIAVRNRLAQSRPAS